MSKILFACAKADFGAVADNAVERARRFVGPEHEVVSATTLNWDAIRQAEGGWNGTYKWAAKSFDACIVLETSEGALGRGTFEIAQNFLRAGKRVGVLRGDKVVRVTGLQPALNPNWKLGFGAVLTDEDMGG